MGGGITEFLVSKLEEKWFLEPGVEHSEAEIIEAIRVVFEFITSYEDEMDQRLK
jgi:hypothetical protein